MTVTTPRKPATLIVDKTGIGKPIDTPTSLLRRFPKRKPYRLYRLLSDLDDMVEAIKDDRQRLQVALMLTRRFLDASPWVADTLPMPDEEKGWAVHTMYREPNYPFAIQTVSWLPGFPSPVHNHATWSIVAILGNEEAGRERNYLWHRQDDGRKEGHAELELASEELLHPGDIIGFTPDAIHSVAMEAAPESWMPTFTFNIYGKPDYSKRYEFNPEVNSVKLF